MKRVLIICYYFPPLGLAGVGRALNLYKYLSKHGVEPHVLTVKSVVYRGYEPELLNGLDTERIHRAGSYDPQRLMYLLGMRTISSGTIRRNKPVAERFFPDSKKGWVGPAVRQGKRLHERISFDAVVSTSPPVSAHLVGQRLSRECTLPWIADFRDFWTMYKVEDSFSSQDYIDRGNRLLDEIRREADLLVSVNPAIRDYLGSGQVITNGFDPELAGLWTPPSDTDRFVIGFPGNLNDERVIDPLLKTVSAIRRNDPNLGDRIALLQLGQADPEWLRATLKRYELQDSVEICGLRERRESIALLSRCALFYLGLTADREQGILPQRLFDMLASGRNILVYASPDSEPSKLVASTGQGMTFTDDTAEQAESFVRKQAAAFLAGDLTITPRPDAVDRYSADALAARFAEIVRGL
jgi:glycosyltransferase involved in cell wall biosynthesis